MRIVVVGNGLIGAAATRHLAEAGHDVALVGPGEPADPERHEGVFASHYDEGRLVSGFSRDPIWAALNRRSADGYARLAQLTGTTVHHRVGRVSAFRLSDERRAGLHRWAGEVDPAAADLQVFAPGDDSWRSHAPMLDVPRDFDVLVERGIAGYLNPRLLIRTQNAVAAAAGATVLDDCVTTVRAEADDVRVGTSSHGELAADRVVVATGAFCNAPGLLPEPVPLRCKTETTIWAQVSEEVASELAAMPVVAYDVDDPDVDDVYLAPPIRYPDGVVRIKMGANTANEQWPTSIDEIGEWFRSGDSDADLESLERVLRAMLPDVEFAAMTSHRCIVTYTPSRYPTVDQAPGDATGRVIVATGGNGTGAQGSDALGWLAAGLTTGTPWPDDIDRDPFLATHTWGELPRDASRAQRRAFLRVD